MSGVMAASAESSSWQKDRSATPRASRRLCVDILGCQVLEGRLCDVAVRDLSHQQIRDHPESGYLFTASVGVRGAPVAPWTPTDLLPADQHWRSIR